MKVLKALAEKFGHVVLPLSPYSPELNLIKKQWGNLKSIYVKFYLILMSFGMLFCPILDLIDYSLSEKFIPLVSVSCLKAIISSLCLPVFKP